MVKSTMTETCSAVLRSRQNCSSDGAERTDDGRAFHARAAVTGKARSPSVVRRVDGMTRRHRPSSDACCRCRYYQSVTSHQGFTNGRALTSQSATYDAAVSICGATVDQQVNQTVCVGQPVTHQKFTGQLSKCPTQTCCISGPSPAYDC